MASLFTGLVAADDGYPRKPDRVIHGYVELPGYLLEANPPERVAR
jgi:hypothetical protein